MLQELVGGLKENRVRDLSDVMWNPKWGMQR